MLEAKESPNVKYQSPKKEIIEYSSKIGENT